MSPSSAAGGGQSPMSEPRLAPLPCCPLLPFFASFATCGPLAKCAKVFVYCNRNLKRPFALVFMSLFTSLFCFAKNTSTSVFFRFFKSCNRCHFLSLHCLSSTRRQLHRLRHRCPLPVYGTSANLTMDINSKSAVHGSETDDSPHSENANTLQQQMHEVTFSTIDKPKLLSEMSALLADVGFNIRKAHVF